MADPTDRELLELAAKAAGLPYRRHDPERKAALEEARAQLQRPIGVEVSEYPSPSEGR